MTYNFDRKKFGKRISEARKQIGFTQEQLSIKTGFSQNTISNWENGNREPNNISDLITLLNTLDLRFEDVIDYESKK
ncbi:helix-turn-helix transcriptional regulator [Erysipelothrix rhusiopathiae]|nr:helix-turn-helix transcriptional regulator [Erysipelothrix rhusiopathiae]MDE8146635.1 helix-turn-helix transcriptional regulator [Erysipelothrix rhusiopathiae]MDE8159943.1 helix-turn-helix transcriptional regulator [Erysipelothrix rhusiopathiae]MDE8193511.1 helix-turn-helix transcriptional regulator [Erysipelothrix rhusiopathiae]MDE8216559.1 helix-turn-helix transcriptional regulator [Erysipelothrix rhusiopathiae]